MKTEQRFQPTKRRAMPLFNRIEHREPMGRAFTYAIAGCLILGVLIGRPVLTADQMHPQIDVSVTGFDKSELGGVIDVKFSVTKGMPARIPDDPWIDGSQWNMLVVSVPNTVRLSGTGFIVVAPGQQLPFDTSFDNNQLRIVFPLYSHGAQPTGSVSIRPLRAGPFRLTVTRISQVTLRANAKEEFLFDAGRDLTDNSPVIVVQDRVTAPKPNSVFRSLSGEYELWVYEERFEVFDARSGGLIFSSDGTEPCFSPTARFLTYRARGGRDTVIADLLARRPIEKVMDALGVTSVAFFAGDAYALVDMGGYGAFDFLSSFIGIDDKDVSEISGQSPRYSTDDCHACDVKAIKVRIDFLTDLFIYDNSDWAYSESDPERPYYFLSLSTGESWKDGVAQNSETGAYFRALFSKPVDFKFSLTSGDLPVVEMPKVPISRDLRAASDTLGEPVLRSINAPDITFRPSNIKYLREFFWGLGLDFPAQTPVTESGHIEHSHFTILEAKDKERKVREWRAEYKALLERLGNGHQTLLIPVVREPHDGKVADDEAILDHVFGEAKRPQHETLELQYSQSNDDEDEERNIQYKIWEASSGRVVSVAQAVGPGGNLGVYDLTFCLFSIKNGKSGKSDNSRCFDEKNFLPDLVIAELLLFPPECVVEFAADDLVAVTMKLANRIFILEKDTMAAKFRIDDAVDTAEISYLGVSSNRRFLLQYNRNGNFYVYDLSVKKRVLSGRSVDNEFVLYDDRGYYESTPEGARYVYWLFPGLGEHFAFSQFESRMHRPDIIRAVLRGESQAINPVGLAPPPDIELELLTPHPDGHGQVRVRTTAQSQTGLGRIRIFVDGSPIKELPIFGKKSTLENDVPIPKGVHWVTAVAYDTSGYSSVPKSIEVDGVGSPLQGGRLFYIGVAIDQYPRIPGGNLRYAKRDMELLANTLRTHSARQYRDIKLTLLSDALATSDAILAELRQVASVAEPEDTVIVSFAGHGTADIGGQFYFLTSAATAKDPETGALHWDVAASILASSRARIIVLLDACHSGFASQETVVPNDVYASMLVRDRRAGMAVLAASKGREFSQEKSELGGGHGLFSYAIASALGVDRRNADLRRAGVIDLDALYQYVKTYVSHATLNSRFPQTPWLSRDEMIGRVPVL